MATVRVLTSTVTTLMIALDLQFAVQPCHAVSLKQIKPPDDSPVCPGNTLTYECVTFAALTWEEDGFTCTFLINELNETKSINRRFNFHFNKVKESTWYSTATIAKATLNDTGIKLSCYDNLPPSVEVVTVWEAPKKCNDKVQVSCFLSMDGSNIGVSVKDPTGRMCVESYLIELNGTSKKTSVEKNLVMFPTAEIFSSTFLKQKMYEVGNLGSLRNAPCLFSITEPNALDGRIDVLQTCDQDKINVAIIFERATFPSESCFSADNITWNYIINVTNGNYSWNGTIDKEEWTDPNAKLGTYEVIITPVATELGLTGSPFSVTVDVSAKCKPATTSTSVVIPSCTCTCIEVVCAKDGSVVMLGVLFGITLLLLVVACVLLFVQCFCRKRIHDWGSFWISYCLRETGRV